MEVLGSVDRFDEFVIEGWVTIQGEPDKKLCLDVCLDETLIGQCIADRYREDLKEAGLAEGLCAFRFNMPSFIGSDDINKIRLRLNNSVLFFDLKMPNVETIRPEEIRSVPVRGDASAGLWIDQPDWLDQLAFRCRIGKISDELSLSIFKFLRDGFLLIENALSGDMVDRLNDAIELVRRRPPREPYTGATESEGFAEHRTDKSVLVDLYAHSAVARDALAVPEAIQFLSAIFSERPKAFRSETYLQDPKVSLHRESDRLGLIPRKSSFAGLWLALDDQAGDGLLECFTGSHRSVSSSMSEKTDEGEDESALAALTLDMERYAQTSRRFALRKGDLLIVHADLVYRDIEGTGTEAGRSLLVHFMPVHEKPPYQGVSHYKEFATANCHYVSQFSNVPSA